MQEVVKNGDAYTLKTTATAVENGKNVHGDQVPDEVIVTSADS